MIKRIKAEGRTELRRFLSIERIDQLQDQSTQVAELQTRLNRLEQIVYDLEEAHYRAVGDPRPRRDSIFVGGMDDFIAVGDEFVCLFREVGGLQPDECVLDVGCGIGRMALPLTKYLNAQSRYEGFDIVKEGIDWCTANITPRFPNFHFQLADVYNKYYLLDGHYKASEYRFPFKDAGFDFVFLTSVFTHMLPADVEHYLSEITRVLKPGGRCFATFFLWNAEAPQLIAAGKAHFQFQHERGVYRVQQADRPEAAVCYDEDYVLNMFEQQQLTVQVKPGAWSGRTQFLSGQDLIIARKL
jgi:SAM-dependent methyltransferase